MAGEFAITEHPVDGERHVIAVRGEIDLYSASELKNVVAQCIAAGRLRIIVDLAETTFVDSSALSVLTSARKRLSLQGGALVIANVDERIARIFQITALDQTFTILPTREAAIAAVANARA